MYRKENKDGSVLRVQRPVRGLCEWDIVTRGKWILRDTPGDSYIAPHEPRLKCVHLDINSQNHY